jgi:nitroimidazol reductase NimA-like FMN-containing flavoprotein (pyridoxamine 5'-phosphate oxidase superfamily)
MLINKILFLLPVGENRRLQSLGRACLANLQSAIYNLQPHSGPHVPRNVRLLSILGACPEFVSMSETQIPTQRTRVVREPQRAVYDRDEVYRILDEGFICHVGFLLDGQPFVIPTSYGRRDADLYIHGSAASRMLRNMKAGVPVCVTVTLLDGLVLARSVFNHSMNYRSVVILGKATLVEDRDEKLAALRVLSEHILPGRWDDARQPNEQELKATSVLRLPIEEFSAKVRTGPPIDDEEDYAFPTWAGVIPLEMRARDPIDDPRMEPERAVPEYVRAYSRKEQ